MTLYDIANMAVLPRLRYHSSMLKPISRLACLTLLVGVCALADDSGKKKVVSPKDSPAGRPFSPGILAGDTLYVSGQGGFDSRSKKIPDSFEDEVRSCLSNVHAVLEAGGMDYSDVVAVQVYLTDMDLFQRMNAVYVEIFKEPRPTRTTLGVSKLAGTGAHIEITVTARK
jgi:2-iminobutanoate/2-iminopropanoate deaminase